jgi:hypothetical protein
MKETDQMDRSVPPRVRGSDGRDRATTPAPDVFSHLQPPRLTSPSRSLAPHRGFLASLIVPAPLALVRINRILLPWPSAIFIPSL